MTEVTNIFEILTQLAVLAEFDKKLRSDQIEIKDIKLCLKTSEGYVLSILFVDKPKKQTRLCNPLLQ